MGHMPGVFRSIRGARVFPLSLVLVVGAACHANPEPDVAPIMSARAIPLSENALASLVLLANNAQRSSAELAASRSARGDVQALARRVATDHASLNGRFSALLERLDIAPAEDAAGTAFRDRSIGMQNQLRAADQPSFDSTYVALQLRSLREMRDLIEQQLMPNARRAEIREYLAELRPAVSAHIANAEQVQATLAAR
jgi:predicted outer membrane protein